LIIFLIIFHMILILYLFYYWLHYTIFWFIGFYDPDGYYFDKEGFDEFGGYYDDGGFYHPGEGNKHEFYDLEDYDDEEDDLIR
jgi:hypothetical protein